MIIIYNNEFEKSCNSMNLNLKKITLKIFKGLPYLYANKFHRNTFRYKKLQRRKVVCQLHEYILTILNLYKMKFQEKTRGFAEQHKLTLFFKYYNGVKRFLNNICK